MNRKRETNPFITNNKERIIYYLKKTLSNNTTIIYFVSNLIYDFLYPKKTEEFSENYSFIINHQANYWTYNNKYFEKEGYLGVELCKKYIDKIVKLMKQVNINSDLTIVIYPWPGQIFRDDKNALQRDIWKNWTQKNNVNFLDLSDLFFNDESTEKERIEIIDRYFLKKDVHLSTNGHNLVSKEFLKKFDKN